MPTLPSQIDQVVIELELKNAAAFKFDKSSCILGIHLSNITSVKQYQVGTHITFELRGIPDPSLLYLKK